MQKKVTRLTNYMYVMRWSLHSFTSSHQNPATYIYSNEALYWWFMDHDMLILWKICMIPSFSYFLILLFVSLAKSTPLFFRSRLNKAHCLHGSFLIRYSYNIFALGLELLQWTNNSAVREYQGKKSRTFFLISFSTVFKMIRLHF